VRSDKANQYVASWRENSGLAQAGRSASATASSLPDIYYIILDGYARADVLEEIYGVDNPELSTYLSQRGFYVAEKSRANYIQTPLSLASSLNYMYLDNVANQVGSQSTNLLPLRAMIERSKIIQELKSRGYQILTFSSGFPITEIRNADRYMSPPGSLNGFETILVTATPIPILLELPFLKTQYEIHGERILYILTHLPDATQVEAPTFVFAHILAPHAPFVFGAEGEPLQPDNRFSVAGGFNPAEASRFIDIGDRDYAQGYRDQVSFLAKRLQVTIDEILARSPKPPVIIIQADHGPGTVLSWDKFQASYLVERTSILNAYYFPDHQYDTLYPEITPVNTFRIILNKYFGTDYELLADTSFFSTYEQPYAFIVAASQDLPSSPGR
jgi:hypothetical protein